MTSREEPSVEVVRLPSEGIWRIGPATDPYAVVSPLTVDELNSPRAGHRFDSPVGNYAVLYFGTRLEGCFGETLARFRPNTALAAEIRADWAARGFMPPSEIPADWRHRRLAVRATSAQEDTVFLDVESAATRATLEIRLAAGLAALDVPDLDVAAIRGGDRRVTRLVSQWAWSQVDENGYPEFAGVRYLSRLNTDWECWAVFDRVPTRELERIAITRGMPALVGVEKLWNIRVF